MASNKVTATLTNLRSIITEAVEDIDIHLKALAFDISTADKETANRTINKIRKKVKFLEEQSNDMITGLERGKQEVERQHKVTLKRQYELTVQNKRMANEVKRLKEELDDTFPIFSERDVSISKNKSQEKTNQRDNQRKYQISSCESSCAPVADSDNKIHRKDEATHQYNQGDNKGAESHSSHALKESHLQGDSNIVLDVDDNN